MNAPVLNNEHQLRAVYGDWPLTRQAEWGDNFSMRQTVRKAGPIERGGRAMGMPWHISTSATIRLMSQLAVIAAQDNKNNSRELTDAPVPFCDFRKCPLRLPPFTL